jgi:hypothetical protein
MHMFAVLMSLLVFAIAFAVIMLTVQQHGKKMVAALCGQDLDRQGLESLDFVAVGHGTQIVRLTSRRKRGAFTSPQWEPLPLAA